MNTVRRLSEHIAVPFHVGLLWLANSSRRILVNYMGILHFSIERVLLLISRNKDWFAISKPHPEQRISRVLMLKVEHCNWFWFWFLANHSSLDPSDISAVSFLLSLWPVFLFCPFSHGCPELVVSSLPPHAPYWAWSLLWILSLSQSKEIHPKPHIYLKDACSLKRLAPYLTLSIKEFYLRWNI